MRYHHAPIKTAKMEKTKGMAGTGSGRSHPPLPGCDAQPLWKQPGRFGESGTRTCCVVQTLRSQVSAKTPVHTLMAV